ncbi:hypothetical protein ElyMa_006427400 [Elysia marginata]|uniref:EF-hand domain-containing protein n=1 Tax=Elysia marginata TaxID=1093978 RepID=A0AAV4HU56_9GAST|nr:hypothetical protein ElyMa_006427400 [Elysia marginata]
MLELKTLTYHPIQKSVFVDRFFCFLDTNHNGFIDMVELTAGARVLLSGTTSEKVNFVFTLFDMKSKLCCLPGKHRNGASIWLQPTSSPAREPPCARYFSTRYLANNAKRIAFVVGFWIVNACLFALNAYLYRDEIEWVVFAR